MLTETLLRIPLSVISVDPSVGVQGKCLSFNLWQEAASGMIYD